SERNDEIFSFIDWSGKHPACPDAAASEITVTFCGTGGHTLFACGSGKQDACRSSGGMLAASVGSM
ncbi:MAG: hypothetical protein ABIR33_14945, partial [Pyrinomonadaceae bacterium]